LPGTLMKLFQLLLNKVGNVIALFLLLSLPIQAAEKGKYPFLVRTDRLTRYGARSPSWMPDSDRFVFIKRSKGLSYLWMASLENDNLVKLAEGNIKLTAVSCDGIIAYTVQRHLKTDIMLYKQGGKHDSLVAVKGKITSLSWSSRGSFLAYCHFAKGESGKISIYNFDKNKSKTAPIDNVISCAWSPDDTHMAIIKRMPVVGSQLILTPMRDGNMRDPTRNDVIAQVLMRDSRDLYSHPVWAPNGEHIAFAWRKKDGSSDIGMYSLQRSRVRIFTFDGAGNVDPAWSPDGKYIIFSSRRGGIEPDLWKITLNYR